MKHQAKVMVYDPEKQATVAVQVELDIDLPRLSQVLAQKAINSPGTRKFANLGRRAVKARLVWRPE